MVDGPFGSPSSNIYRAEHAVLVGTGIGVTPFASILQSIAFRWDQEYSGYSHQLLNVYFNMLKLKYLNIYVMEGKKIDIH